jgi:hypothetical protein
VVNLAQGVTLEVLTVRLAVVGARVVVAVTLAWHLHQVLALPLEWMA